LQFLHAAGHTYTVCNTTAIQAEREAIDFHQEAEDSTPDLHGKAMFKVLAREEGHLALREEELEWITKSGKYFPLHRFTLHAD
jgi:rubrerythrin